MSRIGTIMSTTKVSYFVVLMCYVDSEAYFGVFKRIKAVIERTLDNLDNNNNWKVAQVKASPRAT